MQARELMTTDPAWCTPESTVRDAAELMRLRDCGCIPVLERDSRRLVGVVTDRDIVCRAVAEAGTRHPGPPDHDHRSAILPPRG